VIDMYWRPPFVMRCDLGDQFGRMRLKGGHVFPSDRIGPARIRRGKHHVEVPEQCPRGPAAAFRPECGSFCHSLSSRLIEYGSDFDGACAYVLALAEA
jgi:hypothetical protein